jgi:hypothetical protein
MTPIEKAMEVYAREPCARPFAEDLEAHLLNGYVIATPNVFLMARPVPVTADSVDILNPHVTWPKHQCDAWHIWLAAGDMREFVKHLPWPTKWVCFERRNVLRWRRFAPLLRRIPRHARFPS